MTTTKTPSLVTVGVFDGAARMVLEWRVVPERGVIAAELARALVMVREEMGNRPTWRIRVPRSSRSRGAEIRLIVPSDDMVEARQVLETVALNI